MFKLHKTSAVVLILAYLLQSADSTALAQQTSSSSVSPSIQSDGWGPIVHSLQMSAQVNQSKYYAGELILLKVYIKNIGTEATNLVFVVPPEQAFDINIKDNNGKSVPLTLWGKTHQWGAHPDPFSVQTVPLPTSTSTMFQFVLNRQYDLTLDGTYLVTVKYPLPSSASNAPTQLVSESVKVEIQGQDALFSHPGSTTFR